MSDLFGPQSANREQSDAHYWALCEVARRRSEDLPGLAEAATDTVILNIIRHKRGTLGYFAPESWEFCGNPVNEVVICADGHSRNGRGPLAEDILTTIVHELAHLYAHCEGIKDTSNRGRFHNRRFGEIALALGLRVVPSGTYRGLETPCLSPRFAREYADITARLYRALVLRSPVPRAPFLPEEPEDEDGSTALEPGTSLPAPAASRYVFAACNCMTGGGRPRTIRIARGSWEPESILCAKCGSPFSERSL
ncbi:hypothetical protein SA2016_0848 [Sinomonas atrocyanea]|uniref:SprT-like domain-containing protein n=1 Tax=Sinomonas atrocyanea TaxID=37927 RepID=A0A126ZXC5_9MICC|nr:hypothetical protein [Sinomonas atrocyanea]AMM31536.1 hypothetical protein SA2016_0848 [Sinomonas atrocyanea]GEB66033.1 hypothetical protein SAT01_34810 [Sinomonas atrocyanea]GGG63440.1 hypothetical protein GCM10007172_13390 [Sinomonas atrocyanea]